jgi:hypothetical protein
MSCPAEGWLRLLGGIAGTAFWLLSMQGCATSVGYYPVLEQQLARHDYVAADVLVNKHAGAYGERDVVLYDLDRSITPV